MTPPPSLRTPDVPGRAASSPARCRSIAAGRPCLNWAAARMVLVAFRASCRWILAFPRAPPEPKNHLLGDASAPRVRLRLGQDFPFLVTLVEPV